MGPTMTLFDRMKTRAQGASARLQGFATQLGTGLGIRLAKDKSGIAAVEFALVLPVMVTMYLGCCEVSSGFSASKKVDAVARALADLSSQASASISQSQMNDIIAAATGVMQPFDGTLTNVTISSFIMPRPILAAPVKAYTDWSYVRGGTAIACGDQTGQVPASFLTPGRTVVRADVMYIYRPLVAGPFYTIGNGAQTGVTLTASLWMEPRVLSRVQIDPGVPGTCTYNPAKVFP